MWWMVCVWVAAAAEVETLSLDEALDRLHDANPDLATAAHRVDEARAVATLARAPMLPALQAVGSYQRNDREVSVSFADSLTDLGLPIQIDTSKLPPPLVIQPQEFLAVNGQLRVPLVVPSSIGDALAAARAVDAAESGEDAVRLALDTALVQSAAQAQALDEVVAAATRAQEVAMAHRDAQHRAFDAGTTNRLSVLQADADVVRRESELAAAVGSADAAHRALGLLLGQAGAVTVALPELTEVAPSGDHPELVAARLRVQAAEKQLLATRLRYAPSLSGWALAGASTAPYPTGRKDVWKAGVDLTWTLADGGAREGRMAQASAQLHIAEEALTSVTLRLDTAREDATQAVAVAREQLRLATTQAALAGEAAEVALRGVGSGVATALEARDAEERAWLADVGVARARAQVTAALASLRRAAGVQW